MTIITTIALKLGGMCWFDAVCHAMSACGTCGFSTKNLSIGYFNSATLEFILMCAMAISGIHFGLIYGTIARKPNNVFRSEITRTYFAVMGAAGAAEVLYAKEAKEAEDPKAFIAEKEAEYNRLFANPYQAAKYGYIDDVIEPRNTRFRIIRALAQLESKRQELPKKKHGNIPL